MFTRTSSYYRIEGLRLVGSGVLLLGVVYQDVRMSVVRAPTFSMRSLDDIFRGTRDNFLLHAVRWTGVYLFSILI